MKEKNFCGGCMQWLHESNMLNRHIPKFYTRGRPSTQEIKFANEPNMYAEMASSSQAPA